MLKKLFTKTPDIKTKLPGPKALDIIVKDEMCTSSSYVRPHPLVVKKGRGIIIEDVDGNRFLDFTAGIAVNTTGHSHPKIVNAIKTQAAKFLHYSGSDFYYGLMSELAQRLIKSYNSRSAQRVFFTNSGTESVEAAFKLSRYATKRKTVIAFWGAFHGRTMGALTLTARNVVQKEWFGPFVPEVFHVPYAYCYRCPYKLSYNKCNIECAKYIEDVLFANTVAPEEVSAIFVEPIQGEAGYIVPPIEFHQKLREIANRHNVLLVADEVQSGMGRTGKMFAMEHWGVEADIVCLAKGIASGMPLGAIIAKEDIMTWGKGAHGSTFGGNPVSCIAAIETIDLLSKKLIKNSEKMGSHIMKRLNSLEGKYEFIGDVRGKGLMIGIEIVKNKTTKQKAEDLRDKILKKCFSKGLVLLGCGENSIRFSPPLIINQKEADTACGIFEDAIKLL